MNKYIIIIFIGFLFTNSTYVRAQVFYDKNFYSNTSSQKGKYFSGSGGGSFWSLKKYDSLGRTVEYRSYRKAKLLHVTKYIYNSNNDIIYWLTSTDKSNLTKLDTTYSFEYSYKNKIITYQKQVFNTSGNNSVILELIGNVGDTILTYKQTDRFYRAKTIEEFNKEHLLTYKSGLLTSLKEYDLEEKTTKTTYWEYYSNGHVKRRKIIRTPEDKSIKYAGGPASDDMSYIYHFDKKGRIKKLFHEIDGRKYKVAVYSYKR